MSDLGWPSTALKRMANGLGWPRSERKPAKVSRETSRSGAVEQAAAAKAAPASPEVELSKTDEESAVEAPQPTPARHKGGGAFRARTAASVNEERRALVQRAVTEPVEPTWSAQPTVAVSDRPAVTTNTASLAGARDGGASSAVGLENDSPALDAQELEHPASAGTAPSDPSLQVIHHIPQPQAKKHPRQSPHHRPLWTSEKVTISRRLPWIGSTQEAEFSPRRDTIREVHPLEFRASRSSRQTSTRSLRRM